MNSILVEVKLLTKINVSGSKVIFLLTLQLLYNMMNYYQIASDDRTVYFLIDCKTSASYYSTVSKVELISICYSELNI